MLGLAGIALVDLRLADPTVPSALLLRPAASAEIGVSAQVSHDGSFSLDLPGGQPP
jgi:hypothetical protein